MFSLQAQTLMLMEKYKEAAAVLEETIKLFTGSLSSPCVHLNLASTYLHLKNPKKVSVANCLVKGSITT